jgi:hypothetical protein
MGRNSALRSSSPGVIQEIERPPQDIHHTKTAKAPFCTRFRQIDSQTIGDLSLSKPKKQATSFKTYCVDGD